MKIKALGHVVLRVTDCSRAETFYNGLLGLPICARFDQDGMKMSFFTLGNHHDFAVMESERRRRRPEPNRRRDSTTSPQDRRRSGRTAAGQGDLEAAGVTPTPIDHEVTKSLYFRDPMATAWRSTSMRRRSGAGAAAASPSSLPGTLARREGIGARPRRGIA